jgi:hypothetical protein
MGRRMESEVLGHNRELLRPEGDENALWADGTGRQGGVGDGEEGK